MLPAVPGEVEFAFKEGTGRKGAILLSATCCTALLLVATGIVAALLVLPAANSRSAPADLVTLRGDLVGALGITRFFGKAL